MSNYKDEIAYDGSTKKNYYEINGERIYKGFLLQTSTHFSLDFGVLGAGNGTNAAAAGAIGAAAVGASFVATGVAVGATLAPMAAFLMLAAGGEAVENSLTAFNTYGEYNTVTFKVGCLSTKSEEVDSYLLNAYRFYRKLCDILDKDRSNYIVYTYYLDSSSGACKAIQLRSGRDEDHKYDITKELIYRGREVESLAEMKSEKTSFADNYRAALDALHKLGPDAEEYRGYVNEFNDILNRCFEIVDSFYDEKLEELKFVQWVTGNAKTLDGAVSTPECMLCPLASGDVLPDYPLQHVRYFCME